MSTGYLGLRLLSDQVSGLSNNGRLTSTELPMTKHTTDEFLSFLESEAQFQAKLHEHRVLPKGLDALSSALGRYSWQLLLAASFISALVFEIVKILWATR